MDVLNRAVDSIESRFVVGGHVPTGANVTVGKSTIKFPLSQAEADKALPALLQAATVSPFGHGAETKVDPSASHLTPEQFDIDFCPKSAGILEAVRAALVPDAGAVTAVLHKLNIYGAGGHFAPHKDTPRGADTCFGSLVVSLPVPYKGGELLVRHQGQERRFDWTRGLHLSWAYGADAEKKKREHKPAAQLRWCAFFGDAEHEVRRVSEGHRISLTYVLHRDQAADPNVDQLLLRAQGVSAALRAALDDPEFMPEGGTVGYHCKHLYEETQLAQAEAKIAAAAEAKQAAAGGKGKGKRKVDARLVYASKLKLKNEDGVVAVCLATEGLNVTCMRMLRDGNNYCDEGPYALSSMPKKKDAKRFGRSRHVDGGWKTMTVTPDEVLSFADGTVADQVGEVEWLGSHSGARKLFAERQYGEYFGNEASHNEFYTSASLVATVPAWDEAAEAREGLAQRRTELSADQLSQKGAALKKRDANAVQGAAASGAKRQKAAASASASSSSSSAVGAAPPQLFAPPPTAAAVTNVTRTVHVVNGRGNTKCDKLGGKCDVTLRPGAGLKELKQSIRAAFGKARAQRLGALQLCDAEGRPVRAAKAKDLVEGATLSCTYSAANGNPGFGGFGYGFGRRRMMMFGGW